MTKKVLVVLLFVLSTQWLYSQNYGESEDFSYALKLYNEGFFDIATQQFNLFVNRYPTSERLPDAKFYQGLSLMKLGEYENARVEFQSMAVGFPNHARAPEAWQKVGECYLKLSKKEEAARAFETVKSLYPNSAIAPEALFQAASVQLRSGEIDKAEMVVRDFLDRYPDSPIYSKGRLLHAQILMEKQQFEQARQEFEKVLGTNAEPNTLAETYLALASFYERLGQLQKAKQQVDNILAKYPQTDFAFQALIKNSQIAAKTKEWEEATRAINKNLERFTDSKKKNILKLNLAALYDLQGNTLQARKTLESITDGALSDSSRARKLFYLGVIYKNESKFDESLGQFDQLLKDDDLVNVGPQYARAAKKQTGFILIRQGKFQQGYDVLNEYMSQYPDELEKKEILAELFESALKNNKNHYVETLYQEIIKSFPEHPNRDEYLFKIGKYYFNNKQYKQAYQKFQAFEQEFVCSSKYDSTLQYLRFLNNYFPLDGGISVNKIAGLLGQMLSDVDRDRLKLELARIYLNQLKEIDEAIQLAESITQTTSDPQLLGEANFLIGVGYRRLAEYKDFTGADRREEMAHAETALKSAMENINYVSDKDSLAYIFILNSVGNTSPEQSSRSREINLWKHFLRSYPSSTLASNARLHLSDLYMQDLNIAKALAVLDTVRNSGDKSLAGEANFRMGKILFQQKEYERAANTLKDFLLNTQVHPRRADAYAILANIYEDKNEFDLSAQYWAKLHQEYDYAAIGEEAITRIPEVYLQAGAYKDVIQYTKPYLVEQKSDDILLQEYFKKAHPQLYFFTGKAQYNLQEYAEARKDLLKYLYAGDGQQYRDETLYLLADIASRFGDEESALLHLQLASKNESSPIFIQATEKMADIYVNQGKYQDARELYSKLIDHVENTEQQQKFRAQEMICLINQGNFKAFEARQSAFKKMYENSPQRANYFAEFEFETGKYFYAKKNFDSGIKHFENVIKKYKKTEYADDATYYLGLTYTTLNKVDKAQETLTKFVEKFPNSALKANIYITLGNLYYRGEKPELAVSAFKKSVEFAEEPETRKVALTNLMKLYQDLGLWDGALAQARTYIKEFPNADDLIEKKILIGSALIQLNRNLEAVDYLRSTKFEANSDQEPEIQFYIGEAYFNAGQYENAIREFVKIPLLSKQTKLQWEASALYYSGQAYEKIGRTNDAIRMYQEILDRPGIVADLKREAQKKIDQLRNSG